jgi:hypothetical protein
VLSADVTLPLLRDNRTSFIDGAATPRLDDHNGRTLTIGDVSSTEVDFDLGPEMR